MEENNSYISSASIKERGRTAIQKNSLTMHTVRMVDSF